MTETFVIKKLLIYGYFSKTSKFQFDLERIEESRVFKRFIVFQNF